MKIIFTLPPASEARFDKLMKENEVSAKQLMKDALRLYEWASETYSAGNTLYIKDGDEYKPADIFS